MLDVSVEGAMLDLSAILVVSTEASGLLIETTSNGCNGSGTTAGLRTAARRGGTAAAALGSATFGTAAAAATGARAAIRHVCAQRADRVLGARAAIVANPVVVIDARVRVSGTSRSAAAAAALALGATAGPATAACATVAHVCAWRAKGVLGTGPTVVAVAIICHAARVVVPTRRSRVTDAGGGVAVVRVGCVRDGDHCRAWVKARWARLIARGTTRVDGWPSVAAAAPACRRPARLVAIWAATECTKDRPDTCRIPLTNPRAVWRRAEGVAIWTARERAEHALCDRLVDAEHISKQLRVDIVIDAVARLIAAGAARVERSVLGRHAVVIRTVHARDRRHKISNDKHGW